MGPRQFHMGEKQSPEMFYKRHCSSQFRNIRRKTLVLESLFNNVAGLKACNFIKKRLQHRCFPVNIAKFLRTLILKSIWEGLFHMDNNNYFIDSYISLLSWFIFHWSCFLEIFQKTITWFTLFMFISY